jgi:hypothetical protein
MRVELTPTHDVHNFYLRYEVIPEGRERAMLEALGGPLRLEVEVSCFVDLSGNRVETAVVKVPIWPHPGERNLGQARFYDTDARRRFMVNLQSAVGSQVVDVLWTTVPGGVPKEGVTLRVPEGVKRPPSTPTAATT